MYGDIGTSPLYALREAFHGPHAMEASASNILGVLSLIFWSLILVVSIKYLVFILRADNGGEGGIIALMALVHPEHSPRRETRNKGAKRLALVSIGLFGAALLYGDGMITPAISVLSAAEGIEVYQPGLKPFVLPMTVGVLVGLFLIQKRGTALIGALFGPVILVWFTTLSVLGIAGILREPGVLLALDPRHGLYFFLQHGTAGFVVLGAVFLAVTGSEALYADMGHFGRGPIRFTWFLLVLPALVLNYFGQGALLLTDPSAVSNPFYGLAPRWFLLPLIVIATMATVIASQAIISGAFSLTAQAVKLGYAPRLKIKHTSASEIGQIYVPYVNWTLMFATIFLVLEFQTSSNLAGAYGIAVATDMIITTILFYVVAREHWGWNAWLTRALVGTFLLVELAFWGANSLKILAGGWFPLAVAAIIFVLMSTWREGRRVLGARLRETNISIEKFLKEIQKSATTRVRGHAIYMTGNPSTVPAALRKNLEHNRVLHMRVALLSIVTDDVPHVPRHERVSVETHPGGFYRVVARYGFMDEPDAVDILRLMRKQHADFPLADTTFFLGREHLISTSRPGLAPWRERLFGFMTRNAQQAPEYFGIPPDRVIEVGSQVEI